MADARRDPLREVFELLMAVAPDALAAVAEDIERIAGELWRNPVVRRLVLKQFETEALLREPEVAQALMEARYMLDLFKSIASGSILNELAPRRRDPLDEAIELIRKHFSTKRDALPKR